MNLIYAAPVHDCHVWNVEGGGEDRGPELHLPRFIFELGPRNSSPTWIFELTLWT